MLRFVLLVFGGNDLPLRLWGFNAMNREQRRKMMQNYRNKSIRPESHNKDLLAESMDQGIMLGFQTAAYLIKKVCGRVSGVGPKRAAQIEIELINELKKIQEEIR